MAPPAISRLDIALLLADNASSVAAEETSVLATWNAATLKRKSKKPRIDIGVFPFMDLSPELRNIIYRYAIIPNTRITTVTPSKRHTDPTSFQCPSFLLVSRQCYFEAISIFWNYARFSIHGDAFSSLNSVFDRVMGGANCEHATFKKAFEPIVRRMALLHNVRSITFVASQSKRFRNVDAVQLQVSHLLKTAATMPSLRDLTIVFTVETILQFSKAEVPHVIRGKLKSQIIEWNSGPNSTPSPYTSSTTPWNMLLQELESFLVTKKIKLTLVACYKLAMSATPDPTAMNWICKWMESILRNPRITSTALCAAPKSKDASDVEPGYGDVSKVTVTYSYCPPKDPTKIDSCENSDTDDSDDGILEENWIMNVRRRRDSQRAP